MTDEHARLTSTECDTLDMYVHVASRETVRQIVERIVAERVSQALEAEADLIGNGTCCPECDAVADAMRDRALLPLNQPGLGAAE